MKFDCVKQYKWTRVDQKVLMDSQILIFLLIFLIDAPEFINSPLTQFDLIEGQSSTINLTARGNPQQIQYKWSRDSDSIMDTNRFTSDGPLLNISSILRSYAGIYKLFATNDLGTSETAIRINVNCKSCLTSHQFFLLQILWF